MRSPSALRRLRRRRPVASVVTLRSTAGGGANGGMARRFCAAVAHGAAVPCGRRRTFAAYASYAAYTAVILGSVALGAAATSRSGRFSRCRGRKN